MLPAGSDDAEPEPRTHEGRDWTHVLDGTLRLVLGEHDIRLAPGEAAEFDVRARHWFGASSAGPVEFLSLIGRQGERARDRRGVAAPVVRPRPARPAPRRRGRPPGCGAAARSPARPCR
ncbi:cupin domain-containing protein [Modestobacter lacusdianchii]